MKFTTLDLLLNIVLMFLFEAEVLQDVATFSSFFFFLAGPLFESFH